MQSFLWVFLVFAVFLKDVNGDLDDCIFEPCGKLPFFYFDFDSNYCNVSKTFLICLEINILHNPYCSGFTKSFWNASKTGEIDSRSRRNCSEIIGDSNDCNSTVCTTQNFSELYSNYCDSSRKFLVCLDKNVIYNPYCSDTQKKNWDLVIGGIKTARSVNHCSGDVTLTSSIVMCLVGIFLHHL
ncbi:unnamed protein product [Lymnaea stagnalis]|uniref:Uncharacterized protein n=1 Tax=Lymnaea stagnalis TaxID=6523 RepID=A0AAV2ILU1_LYMST